MMRPNAALQAVEDGRSYLDARINEQKEEKSNEWPADLAPEAFHGLAGEIVRAISPETEADDAAILVQVLGSFGALVGKGPHVRVEGDQHHAHLFTLIVGASAKARKGTSWGRTKEIFSFIHPVNTGVPEIEWPRVVEGLSSGEGLKYNVRDRQTNTDGTEKDPGVHDKRLLVVESEFAQVLRQCARAGNTLSPTLRCAWDGSKLQSLTKNDPVVASDAHISIIGHITADELKAELTQTDSANGFANRFLFMSVQRSKKLPFGGKPMPAGDISQFAIRLAKAADKARARMNTPWEMTPAAKVIWEKTYEVLSEASPGLFGAVTARAEAQCLRLSLIYSLIDGCDSIDKQHIMAALAVWSRAEESAKFIFGSSVGDRVADEILRALKKAPDGLTRTEISRLFNNHQSTDRIGAALDLLKARGLARFDLIQTGGAPKEIWRCAN